MRLDELAKAIGAEVVGDGAVDVTGVSTLDEAAAGQVSFLANQKYAEKLETTQATAVVVAPGVENSRLNLLVTKDPYGGFMRAVVALHGFRTHPHEGVHPKAHVDPTAAVGEGTVIYPFAFVGPRARIGRDCVLFPNVCVYDDCVLGDRVTLHAGTVIGQDGFGYASLPDASGEVAHHKIPQVGNAVIEDDVEMGANCSVDRATLGSTVVGRGSKFSDGVTIGHGTKIGPHALFVAQVGLAGSVSVGHHATMAGQVGVAGHLKIGENVTIAAQSGVMDDLPAGGTYLGSPAMPAGHARRVYALFTQLPDLVKRVRGLEKKHGRSDIA